MVSSDHYSNGEGTSVALFATCLVDLFRPSVGFAAAKLLEDAGLEVAVPRAQTCCGQPAYNEGDRRTAADLARRTIEALQSFDAVTVPLGSCAAMIKRHYPALLAEDAEMLPRAEALAANTFELVSFLADIRGVESFAARHEGPVAYHDSCSGLRELGAHDQPRRLLASLAGLELREIDSGEACCGFGGTFCVKYPDIAEAMTEAKIDAIEASGASLVVAGDLGCLLVIAGALTRRGSSVEARHVAKLLAGRIETPAIGAPPNRI